MCYVVLSEEKLEACGFGMFAALGNDSTISANTFKQLLKLENCVGPHTYVCTFGKASNHKKIQFKLIHKGLHPRNAGATILQYALLTELNVNNE